MTAVLHNFSIEKFEQLPHFDEAKLELPSLDEKIQILGEVITKHNIPHAGVALLHKHFDLNDNERLVEMSPTDHVSEIKASQEYESALPYLWRYDDNGWYPLEFTAMIDDEFMSRTATVISNTAFLEEFATALISLEVFHK